MPTLCNRKVEEHIRLTRVILHNHAMAMYASKVRTCTSTRQISVHMRLE